MAFIRASEKLTQFFKNFGCILTVNAPLSLTLTEGQDACSLSSWKSVPEPPA